MKWHNFCFYDFIFSITSLGIHMSGIMAILFCGIVMSHYTHFNLSTVTQITMQQTMRTLSFIAETCIFAYLGLAIFSFNHRCELALVIWAIILCLLGRAANIFPLAWLVNKFREHKITNKMQFVMWFSGLRGKGEPTHKKTIEKMFLQCWNNSFSFFSLNM